MTLMIRLLPVILSAATLLLAADAELILHNGKIVTVDGQFSIQQAVAIKSGTITAVGPDASVLKAERGNKTAVIDLHGRTVLPGLVDAHVHALEAGLSEFRAPIPLLDSFAAVQAYIRQQAARTPKGEWIVVPRTFPTRLKEMRMPTRDVLDTEKDHPVLFDASYVVILNSYALKMEALRAGPLAGLAVAIGTGDRVTFARGYGFSEPGRSGTGRAHYSLLRQLHHKVDDRGRDFYNSSASANLPSTREVGDLLPDDVGPAGHAAIRDILHHTAGLPNYGGARWRDALAQDLTPKAWVATLRREPLRFPVRQLRLQQFRLRPPRTGSRTGRRPALF